MHASRRAPEDLVAERDRVVRKTRIRIPVNGPFPDVHGRIDVADLLVQVTNLVVQGQLFVELRCAFESSNDLEVGLDGLIRLVLELELAGLVLELLDVQLGTSTGLARFKRKSAKVMNL